MNDLSIQGQLVSIDWLSFSITLAKTYKERVSGHTEFHEPPGYHLVEAEHGTPQYAKRHLLLSPQGDKMLTILTEPHSHIINADDAFVEVANPLFYTWPTLDPILDLLEQIHSYSFRSLSRLDVACDFTPTEAQQAIIRGLQDNTIYCTGKREGVQFHDYSRTVDGVKQTARQLSWGSKYSDIRFKLYNKSLEVYQPDDQGRLWCSKPWITRVWQTVGLPQMGVWRIEVSMMGASTYTWRGDKIGWSLVSSGDWVKWYYDTIATRFVLRRNQGHKCRTNDDVVDLISIPDQDHYRTREIQGDGQRSSPDHASELRACIKQLERPEVAYSPQWRDIWLQTTATILDRGHLHPYFQRVFGMTFEEYAATVGDPLGLAK